MGIWKEPPQLARLRPVTDDDLRAGQVERQECRYIFFHRQAADIDKNRAWQIDCGSALGTEQIGIDAARPHR